MEAGIEAGREEEGREERRSLSAYGLKKGRREYSVSLASDRLGLRGTADMVIWAGDVPESEVIVVDYKLSVTPGEHFQLQLMAYALLLEENTGLTLRRGFLYEIPVRKAIEVRFTARLRKKLLMALEEMHAMLWSEHMPDPTPQRGKCLNCEFRRFCNDVV